MKAGASGARRRGAAVGELIFVTGGARSGKSAFAVRLALERGGRTAFVATCVPRDPEMEERVRLHRLARPAEWGTIVEERDLSAALGRLDGRAEQAIVDCATMMVANCVLAGEGEEAVLGRVGAFVERVAAGPLRVIVVSNEVGMGLVPDGELGRRFRDAAGRVNQLLAKAASEAYLLVAGMPLKLKGREA